MESGIFDLVPENIPAKGWSWFGAVHNAHPNSEVSGGAQKVQIRIVQVKYFQPPVDQLIQLKVIIIFSKWIVEGVRNPEDEKYNHLKWTYNEHNCKYHK